MLIKSNPRPTGIMIIWPYNGGELIMSSFVKNVGCSFFSHHVPDANRPDHKMVTK